MNWEGTYFGVVPCSDCPGIETRITLNEDETYQISWKYQGMYDKIYQNSGSFQWDTTGGIITLGNLDKNLSPTQYRVGENHLFQLDMDGNRIAGEFEDNYTLTKKE